MITYYLKWKALSQTRRRNDDVYVNYTRSYATQYDDKLSISMLSVYAGALAAFYWGQSVVDPIPPRSFDLEPNTS